MMEQVRCVLARQLTDRGKPLEMVVTAYDRDRELVQQKKRNGLLALRVEGRLTRIAVDGRVFSVLKIYWWHCLFNRSPDR